MAATSRSAVLALLGCGVTACGDTAEPLVDAPPVVEGNYYMPSGTTLTPFLSTAAEHAFPSAGDATETGKDYLAVIETLDSRIVIDLYEDQTPITVNSFVWLALHHFYDGLAFHRVISGFVAQAGDPNTLQGAPGSFAPQHNLDGMYTIFGRVTEGSELFPRLVRGEPPANPTRMQRVYIVERPRL